MLYLCLIHPQLTYCSQIWRPRLLKNNIIPLEKVQCRATKYILNDFSSDYKSHLVDLKILSLMIQLELNDMMFFIRCLKEPNDVFSVSTRSSSHLKLWHTLLATSILTISLVNVTFPAIDLLKRHSICSCGIISSITNNPCSFHFVCPCTKCLCLSVTLRF